MVLKIFLGAAPPNPLGPVAIDHSRARPGSRRPCIQVKNLKIFMERLSLVVILCFRQWHIFQKWGEIQRSKGRGHEQFFRGQAPDPVFARFSPPNTNFVPMGLVIGMHRRCAKLYPCVLLVFACQSKIFCNRLGP